MNVNRYLIASLAVFVAAMGLDYVINGVILKDAYEATKSVWRPDMASKTWIFFLIDLIYAFPFTYIFVRGYERKGIIEGVRFGAIVGVLISVPMAYGLYALLPVPYSLALQWFLYGFIEAVLLGLVAAAVYRPKTTISSFSVGRKRRAQLSFGAEQNGCPECERLFRKEREAMVQFTAAEVHRRGFHPTNVSNVSIDADKKDLLRRERLLDEAATSLEHLRAERHIHLRTHTQSVFHKLRDSGYEVYAISPNATETESVRCYPDLASIPGNSAVLSITSASSSLLYRRLAGNISLTFMTSFPLQTHRWARLCTLRFGLSVRADPSLESTTDPPPPSRTDR
jgi:hypothetical protein